MTSIRDDTEEIAALRNALEAAENAGDPEAAAACFADDVVIMVPDFPVQEGKAVCVAFLHDVMGWLRQHFQRRIAYVSQEMTVFVPMLISCVLYPIKEKTSVLCFAGTVSW